MKEIDKWAKTHWRRHDYRIESLKYILSGLENSVSQLDEVCEKYPIYGETFYSDEVVTNIWYGIYSIAKLHKQ